MMPSTRADTPELALPLRFAGGREVLVEQGSSEELVQSVTVAARVLRGAMDHDPELGSSDQTFREGGVDTERLRAELRDSTDRRADAVVEQQLDAATAVVTARVRRGEEA